MISKLMRLQGLLMELTSSGSTNNLFPLSMLQEFLVTDGNILTDWQSLLNLFNGDMDEENLSSLSAIFNMLYGILSREIIEQDIAPMVPVNITALFGHIQELINSKQEDQPLLIGRLLNRLDNDLQDVPMWPELQRYVHMLHYFININQKALDAIRDGDLTLGGLLTNQSEILALMMESLEITPEVAMDILQASLNFDKLFELMDPTIWESISCDASQLSEIFDFGSSVNVTKLIDALCGANFTRLANQLANNFEVDQLMHLITTSDANLPKIDWVNTISKITNMYQSFLHIIASNGTLQMQLSKWQEMFMMNSMDMNDIINNLSNLFGADATALNPDGLGGLLNELNSQLEDIPVWNEVQRAIHMLSYVLDLSEKGLQAIQDGELTLGDFLGNQSEIISWMQETLKVSPTILQELFSSSLNPEKVLSLADPMIWENLACDGESLIRVFDFDPSINITNLINALCGVNFTTLAQHMADEFNVDRLAALLNPGYSPPAIDWREMIEKVTGLQGQIMDLMSSNSTAGILPLSILQDFFTSQGNILMNFESIFNLFSDDANDENLLRLSAVFDQLYDMLEQQSTDLALMAPFNISALFGHIQELIESTQEDQPTLIGRLLDNLSDDLQDILMWSELQRYMQIVNYFLDLNQKALVSLKDGDLTLGGLLTNQSEVLALMMESLEITPEVAMDILQASLNFDKLFELMDPTKWESISCDTSELSEIFDFGSSANLTKIIDALCGANFTQLANQLADNFGVQKLMQLLTTSDADLPKIDWTNTISKITSMYQSFLHIIASNGTLQMQLSKWQDIFMMNSMDMNDIISELSSLFGADAPVLNPDGLGGVLNELNSQLEDNPVWNEVQRAIHVLSYFLDLSEKGLEAMEDGELTLIDFLGNRNEVLSSMVATLNVSPTILQELLTSSLDPEKVLSLADPMIWENLACDGELLTEVFDIDSSLNVTNLINALCGVNFTTLAQQLADEFDVDRLAALLNPSYSPPTIDWREMIAKVTGLQGQIMDLMSSNSTAGILPLSILQDFFMSQGNILMDFESILNLFSGDMNDENLSRLSAVFDQLFDMIEQQSTSQDLALMVPFNISALFGHIQELMDSTQEDQPTLIGRLLDSLSDDLQNIPMWSEVQRYMQIVNYFIDLNQKALESLKDGDLTMSGLLTNQSEVLLLMIESLEITPDVAMDILQASLNFNKLFELMDPLVWESVTCDANKLSEIFDFGQSANLTHLINVMCGANFTQLADQLADEFEVDQLILLLFSNETDLPKINWTNSISKITNMYQTFLDLIESNGTLQMQFLKWQEIFIMSTMGMDDMLNDLANLVGANMTAVNPDGLGGLLNELNSHLENNQIWNEVKRVIHILSYFLDLSKKGLHAVKDGELTLADFLGNRSEIVSWMEDALKVSPEIIRELLATPLNPQKVLTLVDPNTWGNLACNTESLKDVFDFDSTVNITNLINSLCGANLTSLAHHLANEFDVDKITSLFDMNSDLPMIDWTKMINNILEVQGQLMEALLSNSNTEMLTVSILQEFLTAQGNISADLNSLLNMFDDGISEEDISRLGEILSGLYNILGQQPVPLPDELQPTGPDDITKLFNLIQDLLTVNQEDQIELIGRLLNRVGSQLGGNQMWSELQHYVHVMNYILDLAQRGLDGLKDGDITLGGLLANQSEILSLMTESLRISPSVAMEILQSSLNLNKLSELIDPMTWNSFACDADQLSQIFDFGSASNLTEVVRSLCGANFTQLANRLAESFGIAKLQMMIASNTTELPEMDWADTVTKMTTLYQSFLDLMASNGTLQMQLSKWQNSLMVDMDIEDIFSDLMQMFGGNLTATTPDSFGPLIDVLWKLITSGDASVGDVNLSMLLSFNASSIIHHLQEIITSYGENQLAFIGNLLNDVSNEMEDVPMWSQLQQYIHVINYFVEFSVRIVRSLNDGDITLGGMLNSQDQILILLKESLNLSPDAATDLLSASLNPDKVFYLVDPRKWDAFVCDGDKLTEVFDFGSSVNVSEIVNALCGANFTEIATRLAQDFDVDKLMSLVSNTTQQISAIDWKQTIFNVMELYTILTDMMNSATPIPMMPISLWQDVLMESNLTAILSDLADAFDVEMAIPDAASVVPIFENLMELVLYQNATEWREFLAYMDMIGQISEWLTNELEGLIGMQLNLASLFKDSSAMAQILRDTMNLSPEAAEAMLKATISPSQLSMLLNTRPEDLTQHLCNTSFIQFPTVASEEAYMELQSVLCQSNATRLVETLISQLSVQNIISEFENLWASMTSGLDERKSNLTGTVENVMDLVSAIENMLQNPASIDQSLLNMLNTTIASDLLNVLQGYLNSTLLTPSSATINEMLKLVESSLRAAGVWDMVRPQLELFNVFIEAIFNDLQDDLDLTELMRNPSMLLQYLEDRLKISPELIQQAFLMDQFDIWKLAAIFNEGAWKDVFCDQETFTTALSVPLSPVFNATAIQEIMCHINVTTFFKQAEEDLGIDILALRRWMTVLLSPNTTNTLTNIRDFDWEDMTGNIQQLTGLFDQLQTVAPGLSNLTGVNFTEIQLMLERYMEAVGTNELQILVTVLESLDPLLSNEGFWRTTKGYMESIGNLAEWFNDRYAELESFGFNLTNLVRNKTELIDVLSTIMSEDMLLTFMNAVVKPHDVIKLIDINTFQITVCDPEEFIKLFDFPDGFEVDDVTLLQQALCVIASNESTADMFVNQLLSQMDVTLLYKEIEKLATDNYGRGIGADDVEWHRIVVELQHVMMNIAQLLEKDLLLNNVNLQHLLSLFQIGNSPLDNFEMPGLESLPGLAVPLCNAITPYFSESQAWKEDVELTVVRVDHTMAVVNNHFATMADKLYNVMHMERNISALIEFTMETVIVLPDVIASAIVILTDATKFRTWMDATLEVYLMDNVTVAASVCDEAAFRQAIGVADDIDTREVARMMCGMGRIGATEIMRRAMEIMETQIFEDKLQDIWNAPIEELGEFNCSTFVPHVMDSIDTGLLGLELLMNGTIVDIFSDIQIVDVISLVTDLLTVISPTDLEKVTELLQYLGPFLDDDTMAILDNLDVVQPYIGLIQGWLEDLMMNATAPGTPINFTDIFTNSSDVRQYLTDVMGLDDDFVRLLMNSTVNTDKLLEIIQTGEDVLPILCGEDAVGTFIFFPSSSNMTIVRAKVKELCVLDVPLRGLENFVDTHSLVTKLMELSPPRETTDWSTLLVNLEKHLGDIVPSEEFLNTAFDMWENLKGALDEGIDAAQILVINNEQIGDVIIQVGELLDRFEPFLHDSPSYQRLREFVAAFDSLPALREILRQMPDVRLSDLVNNAEDFRDYLVEELNFPPEVADDLLRSSLRFESFFDPNATVVEDKVCNEEELSQLLVLPEDFNVTDLINSICTVEQNLWGNITSELITQLNIGTIVQKILSDNIEEQVEGVSATLEEISLLVDTLKPLEEKLPNILNAVQNFSLTERLPPEIGEGTLTGTGARLALQSMTEVMCGDEAVSEPGSVDFLSVGNGRRKRWQESSSSNLHRSKRDDNIPSELLEAKTDFCRSLYQQINNGRNGIIMWAYLKPVILGKIPYAPDNEATRKIIAEANATFQEVADLQNFASTWQQTSETIGEGFITPEEVEQIKETLSNPLVSGLLEGQPDLDISKLLEALDSNVANILGGEANREMDSLLKLLWEITQCIELDRFEGYATEEEMVERAKELDVDNKMLASIFFKDFEDKEAVPKHVKYKIRMDIDNTPKTDRAFHRVWSPTPKNNFISDQRYFRGFVYLQDMVDRAIIKLQSGSGFGGLGVYTQLIPYPCHASDMFARHAAYLLPVLLTLSFVANIAIMTYRNVYDKEHGLEEIMKIMGLPGGVNWCAWFLNNFILLSFSAILLVVTLKIGDIFAFSDWLILILFVLCFCFSLVMMCYMVGSFFQRANMSSVAAILVYLLSYLPYVIVFALEDKLNFWQATLTCLSSTTALSYGCTLLAVYEEQGIGIHWDNIKTNPIEGDVLTFDWVCAMMMIDGVIYFIIGWYINNVYPGQYGIPRPFYFPLTASYWNCCARTSRPSPREKYIQNPDMQAHTNPTYEVGYLDEEGGRPGVERPPIGLDLGVAIDGLTKKYGNGKRRRAVVDDLTLNFYEGQITSFLGHNGAGKTTTISIMTGTIPPTTGTVYHHGKNIVKHTSIIRKDLGLCPQHNALYEDLTVEEHLQLYGQIKGFPKSVIKRRAHSILEDVGLMDHRKQKVKNLSGGMKRKLSVAIAFFAGSRVVILDEPTSGIDPMARRGIWDLILRNRQDRTIILCTHHMDEADFLGDRIAILDRGTLRACGSPLFLKRRFGDGYKLTLSKVESRKSTPEKHRKETEPKRAENIYEEFKENKDTISTSESMGGASSSAASHFDTNIVTDFIQSRIEGAQLIEDVGSELSYTLPITRGQLSNFSELFADLDANMSSLHVAAYGISNTTLEQVFLKLSGNQNPEYGEGKLTAEQIENMQKENWNLRRTNEENSDVSYTSTDTEGDKEPKDKKSKRRKEGRLRGDSDRMYVGVGRGFVQLGAMLIKRFNHVKRDIKGYFWTLIMPAILIAISLFFSGLSRNNDYPALQLTPRMFGNPNYVFYGNNQPGNPQTDRLVSALLGSPGIGTTCMADADQKNLYPCEFSEKWFDINPAGITVSQIQSMQEQDRKAPNCTCSAVGRHSCPEGAAGSRVPEWLTNTTDILQDVSFKPDLSDYLLRTTTDYARVRFGGLTFGNGDGGSSNGDYVKVWYDSEGFHSMPTFINVMNNVILRSKVTENGDNPALYGITAYNHPIHLSKDQLAEDTMMEQIQDFGVAVTIVIAFCIVPPCFLMFVVMENLNGIKRLHLVSGMKLWIYWIASFLWDIINYLLPTALCILLVYLFDAKAYASSQNLPSFVSLLLLFGWSTIPLMYIFIAASRIPAPLHRLWLC
ncbi:uncharacterized protein [Ptychodera flava]|uniref:uncharacterized protein n=1 Tax=Ptychodera flava TaxID=63121 RepID=UPI00396A31FB